MPRETDSYLTPEFIADVCRSGDHFEPRSGAEAARLILAMAARLRLLEELARRADDASPG